MSFTWDKYGIDTSKVSGGKCFCPKCHGTRKNKRDKSLSVDLKTGLFNCHHCDFRGCAVEIKKEKREFVKPQPRLEKLSKEIIEKLETGRKISNNTLLRFGVTEAKEWMPQFEKEVTCICFNYYRDEEIVNIKFRGPKKSFKMVKDAELIFYNLDQLKNETTAIIVEGEMDCLTLHECGIFNSVSVPNGASKGNQKLEYLDNCWQSFEDKKKIILAVDNDEAGLMLREELARRLGKERCYIVTYPEGCKDINDVLVNHGKNEVQEVISMAKEWPLEGIVSMDEMYGTICNWYENGYPAGAKSGVEGLDQLLTFAPGQLTTITGIPSHGKDEYTNGIITGLAVNEGWRFGICGFEEEAEQTVTKLVEKIIGKAFDFRKDPSHRISVPEFEKGIAMVDKLFSFYKTGEIETDIETLLGIADMLVLKRGIKGLVLNPWNWIENLKSDRMTETEYVSWALTKIISFARKRGVHVFLIAHTTKMQKDKATGKYEVPTLYSISGSAHFYNKTHNGITIYREDSTVDVYVQKVKQYWLGQKGYSTYTYDLMTRQYHLLSSSAEAKLIPLNGSSMPYASEN